MARKSKPTPEPVDPKIDDEAFSRAVVAFDAEGEAAQAARENALALAEELGYEGELSAAGLEAEIRFYQRRTVEACLELGKCLLLLKELTPHGKFQESIDRLGIHYRMAARLMSATIKFKSDNLSLLKAAGNQSKLLELVSLDDEEIEALENGESARGLTLDKIETMSASELRASLRSTQADLDASREAVAKRDAKVRALDEELNKKRITVIPPDEEEKVLRQEATDIAFDIESCIKNGLRNAFASLAEERDTGSDHRQFMAGLACNIERALRTVQGEYDLDREPTADPTPAYLKDDDTPLEIPEHIRPKKS